MTYFTQRGKEWESTNPGGHRRRFQPGKHQGYTYDAAGNMTNDGFHAYKYDAEGNIVSVDSGSTASYSYDALNHRGRSIVGSTVDEFVYNAAGQRASIWDANTKVLAHWSSPPHWSSKKLNSSKVLTLFC